MELLNCNLYITVMFTAGISERNIPWEDWRPSITGFVVRTNDEGGNNTGLVPECTFLETVWGFRELLFKGMISLKPVWLVFELTELVNLVGSGKLSGWTTARKFGGRCLGTASEAEVCSDNSERLKLSRKYSGILGWGLLIDGRFCTMLITGVFDMFLANKEVDS